MKIIVPMAGMGKRMRPHTLTLPKPLIPIAGKPIVYRLVEDIARLCNEKVEEVAYIIGDFGKEAEQNLINIAENLGAKGSIYYQNEPLGTAHAIHCAGNSLSGNIVVAFADTLFYADFVLDSNQDGIIWTSHIEDPSQFGVVEKDSNGVVVRFWEKPKEFISDEAIIGIYYFKDGAYLLSEIQYLLDNNITVKGEYQLTDALDNMRQKGAKFKTASVTHWLDCGNKDATVQTNSKVLELSKETNTTDVSFTNTTIIQPCYIGKGVSIQNSVIGPFVSISDGAQISNSVVKESIIFQNAKVNNTVLSNSMIGNYAQIEAEPQELSLSDYSTIKLS